uniref:F-box domain-containing protein n=1 Tax=Panagrellus redivivus TaxID=6233 RepID=A0A7E4VGK9_PANRE
MSNAEISAKDRTKLIKTVFEEIFEYDNFLGLVGNEDKYYIKSSDSEDYDSDSIFPRDEKDASMIVHIDSLIHFAMSSKAAFESFVKFIQGNMFVRFRKNDVYFHCNKRAICPGSEEDGLIDKFFKFARKVTFYKMACKNTPKKVDAFVKTMNSFVDLRHIDMSEIHGVPDLALGHLSDAFVNLTDFDVQSDTLVKILKKKTTSFPKLKRLKITGYNAEIKEVVAPAARFPRLTDVDISPSWPRSWVDHNESKDLSFSDNAFPTVKNLKINFEENVDDGFVPADFELVVNWLKKFPSATKAKVSMKRYVDTYPPGGPERYIELHKAFKTTDFGVPLELIFYVDGRLGWPQDEDYEEQYSCFRCVDNHRYHEVVYKDTLPGKKFSHTMKLKLDD